MLRPSAARGQHSQPPMPGETRGEADTGTQHWALHSLEKATGFLGAPSKRHRRAECSAHRKAACGQHR